MVFRAVQAQQKLKQQGINVGVLKLSCPKDIDYESIKMSSQTGLIITYEDHHIQTGIGGMVGTFLAENGMKCIFRRMGITRYGTSGSPDEQLCSQELDVDTLVGVIEKEIKT